MNIFVYFNMMFYTFIVIFMLSMGLYHLDYGIMLEWMLISFNSLNFEIMILIDWISLLFVSVVMLISSMILLYSHMYMMGNKYMSRFVNLLMMFIFSMILMIISPNIISILFGWDGLGLVSYCLVIFYQNYVSYNSGMVTVLCNRMGDIGILMSISLLMMKGSWNFWGVESILVVFMMLLAAVTKSAQIPFSVWLPMAMAAPTPISALVHSSTLVTAGVYLMIRFNQFLMSSGVNELLYFFAVLTMFMAGFMANVEYDLKKIIALSTLSQLGLMMMILSVNMKMVAFYHLLTHAIFKSMLFMCAGIIIHSMMNNQDIRMFGSLMDNIPFTMMSFFISSVSLCGFPFMAGFYSKDYIMELIYSFQVNIFMLILILLSLGFTVSYSIRLFYYMFFNNIKFYSYNNFSESSLMNLSMGILILLSIFMGSLLSWLFFFDLYIINLSLDIKLLTLFISSIGILMSMYFVINNFLKNYYVMYYLSSMWFLSYLYIWVYAPVMVFSSDMYYFDKSWIDYTMKKMINYIYSIFDKGFYKSYMILMILVMYMFSMLMYL